MTILTPCLRLRTASAAVFSFLSDLTQLAAWTSEFCDRVEPVRAGWAAELRPGRLRVAVHCRPECGVIDLLVGPAPDRMTVLPIRVLGLGDGHTLVTVTFVQSAEVPDLLFEIQYRALCAELRGLAERFDGELFAPEFEAELALG